MKGNDIMSNIALQLYSVKELTEVDFLGTIEKVAKIGYDGVEFAGYFNTPAKELKACLDHNGIKAAGSHISVDTLKNELEATIEYSQTIGSSLIICPYLPEELRKSADDYKALADLFNKIGEKCVKNGISFGYHNHDFEFKKFDGEFGLDILMSNTEAELLFSELDTFWVEYSGLKSVDFIERYKERCKVLHIKEMNNLEEKRNTEIGKGIMDFKAIVKAGQKYNTPWFTIEQEAFTIPQLQSIDESLTYLRSII